MGCAQFDASIRTYELAEICAEKLRSTRQTQAKLAARGCARSRGRDFYAHRGVTLSSVTDVFEPMLLDEVRASWSER